MSAEKSKWVEVGEAFAGLLNTIRRDIRDLRADIREIRQDFKDLVHAVKMSNQRFVYDNEGRVTGVVHDISGTRFDADANHDGGPPS